MATSGYIYTQPKSQQGELPFRWLLRGRNAARRQNARKRSASGIRSLTGLIFGCWHRNLSWPFTVDGESYRVCLHCGARREFVPESWRSVGGFYR